MQRRPEAVQLEGSRRPYRIIYQVLVDLNEAENRFRILYRTCLDCLVQFAGCIDATRKSFSGLYLWRES